MSAPGHAPPVRPTTRRVAAVVATLLACALGAPEHSPASKRQAILEDGLRDGILDQETQPPALASVPRGLRFTCKEKLPGYYADVETRCQVWHWCALDGFQFSFLCPNGTVFNQELRICDWWLLVPCGQAENFYGINRDLYRDLEGNAI